MPAGKKHPCRPNTYGDSGSRCRPAETTRLAGAWDIHKAQHWLLRMIASGRLSLEGLVTHTLPSEKLGEASEGLLKDKVNWLGVVIKWV